MARFSIRGHLAGQQAVLVSVGLILCLFTILLTSQAINLTARFGPSERAILMFMLAGVSGLSLFGVVVVSAWRLVRVRSDQHPALRRLSRYGPLDAQLEQIESELARESQVVRIGSIDRSFRIKFSWSAELADNEVWLTPTWIVCLLRQGTNLDFFRLDSLVMVSRNGMTLTLVDRFDVRLHIRGTLDGLTHLMAELLPRVPWALSHFDAETEQRWNDNRPEVIAEVDRRRDRMQIRIADSSVAGDVLQSGKAPGPMEP